MPDNTAVAQQLLQALKANNHNEALDLAHQQAQFDISDANGLIALRFKDKQENNLLHWAVEAEDYLTAFYLICKGFDLSQLNTSGHTPLDMNTGALTQALKTPAANETDEIRDYRLRAINHAIPHLINQLQFGTIAELYEQIPPNSIYEDISVFEIEPTAALFLDDHIQKELLDLTIEIALLAVNKICAQTDHSKLLRSLAKHEYQPYAEFSIIFLNHLLNPANDNIDNITFDNFHQQINYYTYTFQKIFTRLMSVNRALAWQFYTTFAPILLQHKIMRSNQASLPFDNITTEIPNLYTTPNPETPNQTLAQRVEEKFKPDSLRGATRNLDLFILQNGLSPEEVITLKALIAQTMFQISSDPCSLIQILLTKSPDLILQLESNKRHTRLINIEKQGEDFVIIIYNKFYSAIHRYLNPTSKTIDTTDDIERTSSAQPILDGSCTYKVIPNGDGSFALRFIKACWTPYAKIMREQLKNLEAKLDANCELAPIPLHQVHPETIKQLVTTKIQQLTTENAPLTQYAAYYRKLSKVERTIFLQELYKSATLTNRHILDAMLYEEARIDEVDFADILPSPLAYQYKVKLERQESLTEVNLSKRNDYRSINSKGELRELPFYSCIDLSNYTGAIPTRIQTAYQYAVQSIAIGDCNNINILAATTTPRLRDIYLTNHFSDELTTVEHTQLSSLVDFINKQKQYVTIHLQGNWQFISQAISRLQSSNATFIIEDDKEFSATLANIVLSEKICARLPQLRNLTTLDLPPNIPGPFYSKLICMILPYIQQSLTKITAYSDIGNDAIARLFNECQNLQEIDIQLYWLDEHTQPTHNNIKLLGQPLPGKQLKTKDSALTFFAEGKTNKRARDSISLNVQQTILDRVTPCYPTGITLPTSAELLQIKDSNHLAIRTDNGNRVFTQRIMKPFEPAKISARGIQLVRIADFIGITNCATNDGQLIMQLFDQLAFLNYKQDTITLENPLHIEFNRHIVFWKQNAANLALLTRLGVKEIDLAQIHPQIIKNRCMHLQNISNNTALIDTLNIITAFLNNNHSLTIDIGGDIPFTMDIINSLYDFIKLNRYVTLTHKEILSTLLKDRLVCQMKQLVLEPDRIYRYELFKIHLRILNRIDLNSDDTDEIATIITKDLYKSKRIREDDKLEYYRTLKTTVPTNKLINAIVTLRDLSITDNTKNPFNNENALLAYECYETILQENLPIPTDARTNAICRISLALLATTLAASEQYQHAATCFNCLEKEWPSIEASLSTFISKDLAEKAIEAHCETQKQTARQHTFIPTRRGFATLFACKPSLTSVAQTIQTLTPFVSSASS